jgi:hypothetical protein
MRVLATESLLKRDHGSLTRRGPGPRQSTHLKAHLLFELSLSLLDLEAFLSQNSCTGWNSCWQ